MSNDDRETTGEFIVYRTDDGRTEVHLRPVDGTVWMTQKQMAELFGVTPQAVSAHVLSITRDGELGTEATFKKLLKEPGHQASRAVNHYRLDMILAVGYRVRGSRGTQFRQWATTVLHEYLVKGFALNDDRLKDPGGTDYFEELLARIRDIRASERLFYMKVRDLFAATSVDYDGSTDLARTFFQTIQNKLLHAITGHTAAEIVVSRSDASQPNMGLTTFPGRHPRKADVATAKNYLNENELSELNRIVTMFLDFAEQRASRRTQITMSEWVSQTDRFIDFNELPLLTGSGQTSATHARALAEKRYATYDQKRRAIEAAQADREDQEEAAAQVEALKRATDPFKNGER